MKKYTREHFRCGGFTLIEILLAMMITTILAAGINVSYRQVSSLLGNIEQQRAVYQQGRSLIETLRVELSGLYVPVFEDDDSKQAVFELSASNNGQELVFFTLTPAWSQMPAYGKMAKITYSFEKTGEKATLIRKAQLYSGGKAISAEAEQRVNETPAEFAIYVTETSSADENSWQKTYSSESSAAKAIKIHLKYPDGKEQSYVEFTTIFAVRCEN